MPPRHHVPSSMITSFIDLARVDALLEPWVPDAGDRAFVARCLVAEGPAHHRGANYVLLALLELAAQKAGPAPVAQDGRMVAVPMHMPAHVAAAPRDYPLRFPTAALARLAPPGSPACAAMIDCLTDGPPQHALANAAMVCLLERILAALEARPA